MGLEIINTLKKEKKLTSAQLAEMSGVTQSTIEKITSGVNTNPTLETLQAICKVLGCTLNDFAAPSIQAKKAPLYSSEAMKLAQDYDNLDSHGRRIVRLVADEELVRYARQTQDIRQAKEGAEPDNLIYITRWFSHPMSAGAGTEAGDDYPEELELTKRPPRGTSYVAPVRGDSMEPTYHDGDRLFIRSCEKIEAGQIGVFLMDGKQWVKEQGDGVLISHNAQYDPIPMREDIRCQGLVLGVCDESYLE